MRKAKARAKETWMYPTDIQEDELKRRVAADFFAGYDCTPSIGRVDFCVALPRSPLFPEEVESVLWAEAKRGVVRSHVSSLVQLILTIGRERPTDTRLPPKFLGAFDCASAAFVPYSAVMDVFAVNDFNWNVAPSDHGTKEFKKLSGMVEASLKETLLEFDYVKDGGDLRKFVKANFTKPEGDVVRIAVTRNNFTHVYARWREAVMPTIEVDDWDEARKAGVIDADFFLADLLSAHDMSLAKRLNVLLHHDCYRKAGGRDFQGMTLFSEIGFKDGQSAHKAFWNKYRRPPRREYWDFMVERRDLLVPQDVREVKGAFYTPKKWVELSQEYIRRALGDDWQERYYVWDCCAGTGNLLAGLTDKYRIWASTLDQQDVDVMHERIKMMEEASGIGGGGSNLLDSHVFKFDFLNDSFDKLPDDLRRVIADPEERKRLVVYINPPYAEAANARTNKGTGKNRAGLSQSGVRTRYFDELGKCGNELFAQFYVRVVRELKGAKLAMFSTLKMLQGPNFRDFRKAFAADLKELFLVPANTFDNVSGQFPIGFQVYDTSRGSATPPFEEIKADVYDAEGAFVGGKTVSSYTGCKYIVDWLRQYYDKSGERISYLRFLGTDYQNNNGVFMTLSPSANDLSQVKGTWVTPSNFTEMCVYMAARLCLPATWLNDRDQFLFPNDGWAADAEFKTDCLVFALFCGQNRVSMRDGVNHWIPFTEAEVGAQGRFSSHFMSDYLHGKGVAMGKRKVEQGELFAQQEGESAVTAISATARIVLDAGRELWRYYHAKPRAKPDASYYDIRLKFQGTKTLPSGKVQMNPDSADLEYTRLLAALKTAHRTLALKIADKVYKYGFLRG